MSDPTPDRCTVSYPHGRCPNPAAAGLPVCGPCLAIIEHETDPGRRRALATLSTLPIGVLSRLRDDPDDGVRARVAIRDDLDAGTIARYADPDRETSPVVWRAIASTPGGAGHADALIQSGDPLTLMVLAANPATHTDVIGELAAHPDERVASVASTRRDHQPLDARIAQMILDAQAVPTTPLDRAPLSDEERPGEHDTAPGTTPPPSEPPPTRRSRTGILALAAVLVLLAATAAYLATRPTKSNRAATPDQSTTPTPRLHPRRHRPRPRPTTTTTLPAPTTSPGPPTTFNPADLTPVSLEITVRAQQQRFCNTVELTLTYHAPTVDADIDDDGQHRLWSGQWPSGETRRIELIEPTEELHVHLRGFADQTQFQPSGSVDGSFC